jgi:hypothetical protein
MLEDFLKITENQGLSRSGGINYEAEKQILTNYSCGVIFVNNEWKVPDELLIVPLKIHDDDEDVKRNFINQINNNYEN